MADVFGYYDTNRGLLGDALAPAGVAGGEYNPVTPLPTMNVAGTSGAPSGRGIYFDENNPAWQSYANNPAYKGFDFRDYMLTPVATSTDTTQYETSPGSNDYWSPADIGGGYALQITPEAQLRRTRDARNAQDNVALTFAAIVGGLAAAGAGGGGAAGANAAGAPAAAGSSDVLGAGGLFGAGGAPSTLAGLGGGGLSSLNAGLAGAVDAGTAGLTAGVGGGALAGGTGLLNGGFGLEAGAGGAPAAGSLSESVAGTPFQASGEYGAVSGTPGAIPAGATQASGEYGAGPSWLAKLNQIAKMGGGSPQGQAQSPQFSAPLMPQRSGGGFLQQLVKPRPNYLGRFGDAVMASQSANDLLLKSKLFGRERQ